MKTGIQDLCDAVKLVQQLVTQKELVTTRRAVQIASHTMSLSPKTEELLSLLMMEIPHFAVHWAKGNLLEDYNGTTPKAEKQKGQAT